MDYVGLCFQAFWYEERRRGVEEKEKREEREKRLFSLQSFIIKPEYSWRICSKIRF